MDTKRMIIMRGLPGSGKSHWAVKNAIELFGDRVTYCSSDLFFYVQLRNDLDLERDCRFAAPEDLEYIFDPRKLGESHASCLEDVIGALRNEIPIVVIDNTHSRLWEYENFIELAKLAGYEFEIREIACQDKETLKWFFERQAHGVPLDKFLEMWWRWESDKRAIVMNPKEIKG